MRKLFIIGGVAVVAVVAAVFIFISSLDGIVKKVIETVGSQVAGVDVRVAAVKISLTEGKGSITGLTVANPKGFATPTAFSLGQISLALDVGSVKQNPVVLKEIVIAAPVVTYELTAGGSNIEVLQKNVQSFAAKSGGGGKAEPQPEAKTEGSDKKIAIDRLAITGGQVNLSAAGNTISGKLGDIVLTGIGRESGGATPAVIAQKLLDALSASAIKTASSLGVNAAVNAIGDKVKAAVPGGVVPADASKALKGLFK
jgi:uncharacterized protein involved in outer membrane biogenesis